MLIRELWDWLTRHAHTPHFTAANAVIAVLLSTIGILLTLFYSNDSNVIAAIDAIPSKVAVLLQSRLPTPSTVPSPTPAKSAALNPNPSPSTILTKPVGDSSSIPAVPPLQEIPSTISSAPPNSETAKSDARIAALRREAALWKSRKGWVDYHDFSQVKNDVSEDRKRFTTDDWTAWNELDAAEAIVAWSNIGLTAENKERLPVAVLKDGTGDTADRIAEFLIGLLRADRVHIVSPSEAALFVKVNAKSPYATIPTGETEDVATTNGMIHAVWIGGRPQFSMGFEGTGRGAPQEARDNSVQDAASKAATLFLQSVFRQ
jgi:hypothetical protein